ncbi:Phytochrome-like protein cph1 [Fibrella aestuarina BUZ 2]|uniref:histidine kinase n=2 Tax=Fibrella TaxID=861914 RepID=I0K990_9BACT|nr:Phytochrome-like protein cph1 [Fibrella aestuarina BUZ 2]
MGVVVTTSVRNESGEIVDFEVIWFNQKAVEIGTSNSPVYQLGARIMTLVPALRQSHLPRLRALVENQEAFTEAYESTAHRHFRNTYVPFNDGYVLYFDENTALTTATLLQRILDSTPAAIMFFKAIREGGTIVDFEWITVNRRAVEITGLSADQLLHRRLLDVHPHNRALGLFDAYVTVVETGEPYQTETNYARDGVNGWFTVAAIRHDDGIILHTLDITTRKQSELAVEEQSKRLQQMNRELRQMNENLQQFAYSSSHDLQEPLRKIQTFADLLRTNYAPQLGEGADLVNRMHSSAERISVLIRDLLMFSRLGVLSNDFRAVDLNTTVQEVISLRQQQIDQAGAILCVAPLPTIHGNKVQLVQLIDCLLSNALKYQPEGQRPQIDITSQPAGYISPAIDDSPAPRRAYCQLTVTDNGIGFDPKHTERIFQMFQRLHSRNSPYGGTGIGLAVARRIVENHGGFITAQVRTDAPGSVFTVYLPVVD